jgi:hypothetical protein
MNIQGLCRWGIVLLLLVVGDACQKTPVPVPVPTPPPDYFLEGEQHLQQEDFPGAARFYELYLKRDSEGLNRERALFHLALIYSFPESSVHDPARADGLFQTLLEEFPDRPYSAQVLSILELRVGLQNREQQIRRLQEELEQLKEIDLGRPR